MVIIILAVKKMSKFRGVVQKVYRLEEETAALRPTSMRDSRAADVYGDATKGGNQQFNWNTVKDMSYKDRECFLGYTTKIGVLDKGGKWNKRDWWTTLDGDQGPSAEELKRVKEEDKQRLRVGLGLEVDTRHTNLPTMDTDKVREMTKKIKEEAAAEAEEEQEVAEFTYGLGFKAPGTDKVKIAPGAVNNITSAFALDAVGLEETLPGLERKPRKLEREEPNSSSDESQKKRAPRSRSREKKHKKEKKKRDSSSASSSARDTSQEKREKAERKKAKKEKKKAKKRELELKKRYGL
jgi:Multiple myeloma tumor-associated